MDASWSLTEALEYYRSQGAPGAQTALVELLREVQAENGGVIPDAALAEIAGAYGLRESFLTAVIRRYPSLRTQQAPHRLEICGGPNCAKQASARLMAHIENTYGVRSGGISQSDKMYSYPGSDVDLYCDRNSFYSDALGSIYSCKHIDYPVNVFLTAITGILSYL